MFEFLFSRKTTRAAPVVCGIPAHKGFEAVARLPLGHVQRRTFPTLLAAQVWVHSYDAAARIYRRNSVLNGARRYTVRNLETGKFCPWRWTVTRADMVA